MYAKACFVTVLAAGLAGTNAFMATPALSRANVKVTSAAARSGLAPLRNPLSARKLVRSGAAKVAMNAHGKVKAEYIWIGGRGGGGDDYRSKTRVLDKMPTSVDELPMWNYDGSSTGQAPGDDSEVFLKPAFMCKDPMREGDNILVLCEMLRPDMTPIKESTRTMAKAIFDQALDEDPWYGIEQEYTLFQDGRPMGWPKSSARPFNSGPDPMFQFGYPGPQGAYYCAVGSDVSFGRLICEKHLDLCLTAGLNVGGINGEVMPGQWEYQVGPCTGIEAGDHMHMSRFLLNRVCEEAGVVVSFDPKPIPSDDWNGAGCHVNYSTKNMRADGGYEIIKDACEKLGKNHAKHIRLYGEGNERRLTGNCETNSIDSFKWGVADRGASIRIPRFTARDNKGYLEDRRPASNIDPYLVTSLIFDTTCLKGDTTAFDEYNAASIQL
jgi:glutamine synthetase